MRLLIYLLIALLAPVFNGRASAENAKPNIVIILCDDLGIGDVQSFNPELGKIKTPQMDQLAAQGMAFRDAHSGSSVCTPTRYGLLTGRYAWRTSLQSGVVQGFEPCLISPDRPTLGGFLKSADYHCAIIGKWHLNMRFLSPADGTTELKGSDCKFTPPIGATSPDGPIHRGFDYFYGIHHARSMKAIIEQDLVTKHDDVINFLPSLERKSIEYIKSRRNESQPFFLYIPLGSPHTPIVPTDEWKGASGLGDYADFVMQTDHVIGNIVKCLDEEGLGRNTLLFLASDNGCSRMAKIQRLKEAGHVVSAGFRGSKSDIWEGGHRVPFIVRWPEVIQPNTQCDQTICLTDLFATIAECVGIQLPANSCEDSVSFVPAFTGKKIVSTRDGIVHHSISGHFAYRYQDWKLILARGSGGWSAPTENKVPASAAKAQLYHFPSDSQEQTNLFSENPEISDDLLKRLQNDVYRGRSTEGSRSQNDVDTIQLWK